MVITVDGRVYQEGGQCAGITRNKREHQDRSGMVAADHIDTVVPLQMLRYLMGYIMKSARMCLPLRSTRLEGTNVKMN